MLFRSISKQSPQKTVSHHNRCFGVLLHPRCESLQFEEVMVEQRLAFWLVDTQREENWHSEPGEPAPERGEAIIAPVGIFSVQMQLRRQELQT